MKIIKKNLSIIVIFSILLSITIFNVSAKTTFRNFVVDFDSSSKYIRICEYNGDEKNVEIPDEVSGYNVHYIDSYAFMSNEDIENVKFPYYLTNIGTYAFYGCSSLKSVEIPSFVTYIGENAFSYCSGMTSAKLNCQITYLNSSVFEGCSSLEDVILPNSLQNISSNAFARCKNLKIVYIPDSVTSISDTAFKGCSENLCIIASEGSYAQQYCEANGIDYAKSIVNGDVNNDGKINIKDVTFIQKYLAGMDGFDIEENTRTFYASDVDGDGQLDIGDALTIFRFVNHEISVFPVKK